LKNSEATNIQSLILEVSPQCFHKFDTSPVYTWGEKNVRLRESPYGNQFKPDETPWLKEPLACVAEPEAETVVLKCAAQTGKTISMQIASAWALANHPAPTMIVMQDEEAVKDFAKERMLPVIESCEPLRNQFPQDRHRKTNTEIFFASCTLKMGAANNNFLRSWSIRWMFGDEVGAWKPGMVKRARARTTRYWNRKLWFSSTPEEFGDDFDIEYRSGTQEVWSLRCQGCAKLFDPNFYECVKWETSDKTKPDGEWDFEKVIPTTVMHCSKCGHEHANTEQNWRLMTTGGGYQVTNDNPTPKTRSFSFNQLTLPPSVMPWSSLVVDFLKAKRSASTGYILPLREFVTLRLGEPWKESNHIDVQSVVASGYSPADDWGDETHRFLTVDCQQYLEEFWAVVRAWAPGGSSRLLAFRRLSSFDEVRALQMEFKVQDQKTFLDVGYERHRVLGECAKYGWIGMRGEDTVDYQHQVKPGVMVRRPYSKPNRVSSTGKVSPPVFRWSNPSIKDMMHILKTGRSHPWDVCDLGDMADEYAKQIDSERKREVQDKNGRTRLIWQQYRGNHGWDCECMQVVAALVCKLFIEHDTDLDAA
jgi:hypothetical protein